MSGDVSSETTNCCCDGEDLANAQGTRSVANSKILLAWRFGIQSLICVVNDQRNIRGTWEPIT